MQLLHQQEVVLLDDLHGVLYGCRVFLQHVPHQPFAAGGVLDGRIGREEHIRDGGVILQPLGDAPRAVHLSGDVGIASLVGPQGQQSRGRAQIGGAAVELHVAVGFHAEHIHVRRLRPGDLIRHGVIPLIGKVGIPRCGNPVHRHPLNGAEDALLLRQLMHRPSYGFA